MWDRAASINRDPRSFDDYAKILAFDGPLKQLPRSDVRDRSDLLRLSILADTGRRSSGTRRIQPEREVRDRGRTVMAPTLHFGSFHSRSGVEQNKVFAADVTQLNFNETYEVGYALVSPK